MFIVNVLLGAALLLWGRKLFWLFVGAAGFFTGLQIASQLIQGPEWIGIAVGLLFGIIAALLAIFLKSIAIGVAGFLMGGSILLSLAGWFGLDHGAVAWISYIVGGIGGAILIGMFFDWVVILLSSLGGAALIVQSFDMAFLIRAAIFVTLLVVGVVIQSRELRKEKK
jgi:ammonia channel protein AmtB